MFLIKTCNNGTENCVQCFKTLKAQKLDKQ